MKGLENGLIYNDFSIGRIEAHHFCKRKKRNSGPNNLFKKTIQISTT